MTKGQETTKPASSPEDWPEGPSLSQMVRPVLGADTLVVDPTLGMTVPTDERICAP